MQLVALSKREFQNVWRDKAGLVASVLVPLILNVFFALIFYQADGWAEVDKMEGCGCQFVPSYELRSVVLELVEIALCAKS